jgi:hypothetical protein
MIQQHIWMNARRLWCGVLILALTALAAAPRSAEHSVKGWKQGAGWGAVWGKDDEVGALNAITPSSVLNALQLARDKVYEFCYIATVNKIAGTVAGFALRPLAIK